MRSFLQRFACRVLHLFFGWMAPRSPRVLLFHAIDDTGSPLSVSLRVFEGQMAWLAARGFVTWSASRYAEALVARREIPRRVVVITFDDGLENTLDIAMPVLERHGFTASVFVVTGFVGGRAGWLARDASAIEAQLRSVYGGSSWNVDHVRSGIARVFLDSLAGWEQLRRAADKGIEVLSHSREHHFLPEIDDDALKSELEGSLEHLRTHSFGGPAVLAWPYGACDDRTARAARAAGYVAAFAAEPSRSRGCDQFRLERIPVDPRLGVFSVAFAMGAGYDVWRWIRGRGPRSAADRSGS